MLIGRTVLAVFLVAAVAAAQPAPRPGDTPSAQARGFFEQGIRYFNVGDYGRALDAFKQGYLVKPDPAFLFNIGQCHRMMKDFEEEVHAYRAFLREAPSTPNRAEVERFIAEAEAEIARRASATPLAPPPTLGNAAAPAPPPAAQKPRTATIVVESTPTGAEVRVDDRAVGPYGRTPVRLEGIEPGSHILYVRDGLGAERAQVFSVAAGDVVRFHVDLAPDRSGPPPRADVRPPPPETDPHVGFLLHAGAGAVVPFAVPGGNTADTGFRVFGEIGYTLPIHLSLFVAVSNVVERFYNADHSARSTQNFQTAALGVGWTRPGALLLAPSLSVGYLHVENDYATCAGSGGTMCQSGVVDPYGFGKGAVAAEAALTVGYAPSRWFEVGARVGVVVLELDNGPLVLGELAGVLGIP